MENQVNQTETQAMLNRIIHVLMEEVNKMVDSRVERIMATQASAAVFNDSLDTRIREIAQEEDKQAFDRSLDQIHDEVAEQVNGMDLDAHIERAFQRSVNWEEHVQEYVDNELDEKVEAEVSNQIDDAVESKLDDVLAEKIDEVLDENLEDKIKEVLIKIIKGE